MTNTCAPSRMTGDVEKRLCAETICAAYNGAVGECCRHGRCVIKRVGFLLKVKEDLLEEYSQHHAAVWSEMLDALRRSGWCNYSIFAREDGLLFGYFEAVEDFEAALAAMASEDVNGRWQEFMAPYFEIPPGAKPDQMMMQLDEVFHLD